MRQQEMASIRKTLTDALLVAGRELRKGMSQKKRVSFKTPISLVTQTDIAAEKAILKVIHKRHPFHSVLAEESGLRKKISDHKWIIDPLDGTTNFAHDLKQCCTSIAYEREGEVKMGGIYDPFRDELFFAELGKGAKLNRKKIHVSDTRRLKQSFMVTGFPYDRVKRGDYYLKLMSPFVKKTQGVRRLGSAALDLCYVACGRFDAYWEANLNPWDVAAGYLIVTEAGGRVTNFDGEKFSIYGKETLASNPHIYKSVLRELKLVK